MNFMEFSKKKTGINEVEGNQRFPEPRKLKILEVEGNL